MDPIPPPPISILPLLQAMLKKCQAQISTLTPVTPISYFHQSLDPQKMIHTLVKQQPLLLGTMTLGKYVRLVEIMVLCVENLRDGRWITKRNLYYRLEQYYGDYGSIDHDIRLICQNLYYLYFERVREEGKLPVVSSISKTDLGIMASNRCILFGPVSLTIDGKQFKTGQQSSFDIITLPTCHSIQAKSLVSTVIVIEKQSFFYQLVAIMRKNGLQHKYLLVSAKGYPDESTRKLLLQLSEQQNQQVKTFYYLGDYDVYGFDIFLFYALGDWTCKGILQKIELIKLGQYTTSVYFNTSSLEQEMSKFSKEDGRKIKEITEKLQKVNNKISTLQDERLKNKIRAIMGYFTTFATMGTKAELQLLNECAWHHNWIIQLLTQQQNNINKQDL